jgi:hypothetical protein
MPLPLLRQLLLSAVLVTLCCSGFAPARAQQPAATAASAERTFASLEVFPPTVVISSIRDARRVVVTGVTTDGQRIDVTAKATFSTQTPVFAVDPDNYLTPLAAG